MKVTPKMADSRTGTFNHILSITGIMSWPDRVRVAGWGLGPASRLWDRGLLSLSHGGFLRREARIGPGLSQGMRWK